MAIWKVREHCKLTFGVKTIYLIGTMHPWTKLEYPDMKPRIRMKFGTNLPKRYASHLGCGYGDCGHGGCHVDGQVARAARYRFLG